MTLPVEDDFREFVAARWPDLDGVALVVTLDPATATRLTTDALATLHRHWGDALEDGLPGLRARRAVLRAAVAAASRSDARARGQRPSPDAGDGALALAGQRPPDPVLEALLHTVRAASPVERALVGARSLWGSAPEEVASLLGMPVDTVRAEEAAVRARLLDAHDRARAADGLMTAGWALDADVDAAVQHLLEDQAEPPDPTVLVEERQRSVRRRTVLAGGAAVAAVGAAGWWAVGGPAGRSTGGARRAAPGDLPLPAADDPSWVSVSRWAPRGGLRSDAGVQALVIARCWGGARLLWADDVGDSRVVLSAVTTEAAPTVLQVWRGPAGADPASLREVPLETPQLPTSQAVVAVAVPEGAGTLLLLLAQPSVVDATTSRTVLPTPAGTVDREWLPTPLTAGVGVHRWQAEPGPALRVRLAGYDGPPAGTVPLGVGRAGTDPLAGYAEETRRFVAAATGRPADALRCEVVLDAKVGGSVLDPDAFSPSGGDGRVVVLRTTTPDGAVLRSVRVTDDGRSSLGWVEAEPVSVLPADSPPDEPFVAQLADLRPRVGRFLVVAPGAARVQLLNTSPNAYPVSKVTATRDGVAIVEVVNSADASSFRLVRRDAAGRPLGGEVPRASTDLLDLYPRETTLEG